jgi:hypothetical protein
VVSRSLSVTVAALLSLLVAAPHAGAATRAPNPKPTLNSLLKQTRDLPATVKKKQRAKLARYAAHASKVAKKKPCGAVSDLGRYRRVLRGIKIKKGKRFKGAATRLARLGPLSVKASQKLLADTRTKRCGGGVRQSTLSETKPTILKSDENGLDVRIQLPVLRFAPETGGGQTWTKLVAPDTDSPGAPGTPGIPVVTNQFAVPDGATLKVDTSKVSSYTVDGVDVFPAQPDPVDGQTQPPNFLAGPFKTPAFKIDAAAYSKKGLVPAEPGDGILAGASRDVNIGNLVVPTAQYDPASKTLKIIKSVDVNISFVGGNHTFSDELGLPWERPQRTLLSTLLNRDLFRLDLRYVPRRCGEEILVITNPSTRAVADTFATAKRAQGWRTNVFDTGGSVGTTAAQIQTFIRGRLTQFLCTHPSYVVIVGDDELVPTFPGINGIPSDLQYSMRNDTDELPDVAVGRLLGQDTTQLTTIVNKIVNYENNPLPQAVRNKATIAAQFQDDDNNGTENRTFIQFAETVRNGLTARGVAVDRVYGESPGNNPQNFNDGTPLPAALKKPTFGWNGTGAQVTTAWNQGRFMVIHRDHGYSDGWGTPGYGTGDVNGLTNGSNLPVVLSINCSSAAYDYDETSFVQQSLVNPNGGAVGAFGDTRDSPTWHNSQIALGFVDALLPTVLGSEGPSTRQRMGDALIHGKLRLNGLAPATSDGSTRNELYLWHFFGDPSMQMWGGGLDPLVFNPDLINAVFKQLPGDPPYSVVVNLPAELNGQTISLLRFGDVVGKANVADGKAEIFADFGDGIPGPGELQVAADTDGAAPVIAPVKGVPEPTPPPPPPPADTNLSATCPPTFVSNEQEATITGKLTPAFAGATITIKVTSPDTETQEPTGSSFELTATTDANGNWSTQVDTSRDDDPGGDNGGTWKVEARYAGDAGHKPSSAPACTFQENGN